MSSSIDLGDLAVAAKITEFASRIGLNPYEIGATIDPEARKIRFNHVPSTDAAEVAFLRLYDALKPLTPMNEHEPLKGFSIALPQHGDTKRAKELFEGLDDALDKAPRSRFR